MENLIKLLLCVLIVPLALLCTVIMVFLCLFGFVASPFIGVYLAKRILFANDFYDIF